MSRTLVIRSLAVLFVIVLVVPMAGCTPEDKALAMSFITDYFTAKVDPSQNGIQALGNLWGAVTGKGGDPEVNAALQAKGVIDTMAKAETLSEDAEQLWESGNDTEAVKKLEEAMELRPQDVSYRIRLSAIQCERGDVQGATQLVSGDGLDPDEVRRQHLVIADYSIREYTRALENLVGSGGGTVEQRAFLYYKLMLSWATAEHFYKERDLYSQMYECQDKKEYYERAFEALDR